MAYPDGTVPTDRRGPPDADLRDAGDGPASRSALWRLRDRFRPGVLFALYLVFAGIERFLVEFVRRNDPAVLGLTVAAAREPVVAGARRALLAMRSECGELQATLQSR